MTSVQAAQSLGCSDRHVRKLIEKGKIKAVIGPFMWNGRDRYMIPRKSLIEYMAANGCPMVLLDEVHTQHIVVAGCSLLWSQLFSREIPYPDGWKVHVVTDLLNAGLVASRITPHILIIDQSLMDSETQVMLDSLRKLGCRETIVLMHEDRDDTERMKRIGFDTALKKPVDHVRLAKRIMNDSASKAKGRKAEKRPRTS